MFCKILIVKDVFRFVFVFIFLSYVFGEVFGKDSRWFWIIGVVFSLFVYVGCGWVLGRGLKI